MKMFKKFTQMALVAGLLIGGLAVNAPSADAKVVASGKTSLYFKEDAGAKMKMYSYNWDQKKVGKYTYHTLKLTSPYKGMNRQATRVMLFKIDSKGVQKQVRVYDFKKDGKSSDYMKMTVRSKTSSKGKYFYYIQSMLSSGDYDYSQVRSKTKTVTIK